MNYPANQIFCIKDYETFSEINLKHVGSFEYSKHPSTEVLCVSVMVGTMKQIQRMVREKRGVKTWFPRSQWSIKRLRTMTLKEYAGYINDPTIVKVAHNAMFEKAITQNVLPKYGVKCKVNHSEWIDTAVLSAVQAMPRSLDGATAALNLNHQKDKEGHRLMLSWSKPKKPSKVDPSSRYMKNFARLVKYCEHDIYAEAGLLLNLNHFFRVNMIFGYSINK
jgi:DNA polymerase